MVSVMMLVTPIISAVANQNKVSPVGAFKIIIHPPTEPLEQFETREIRGTHQLIPGALDQLFPLLWMSQYSLLECKSAPDWVVVTIPDRGLITPPDGVEYSFTILISLQNDAPPNTVGKISMGITTGRFMRTMFPSWFPLCNEFNLDQEFTIRTSDW